MAFAAGTAPLAGIRVIETGALEAGAYCAKILADFGADVTRIEDSGDTLRSTPPLVDPGNGRPESAFAAWLNTGKRSMAGIAADAADTLLAEADLLIDSGDPATASARHSRLRCLNPRLSIVSLSWFGETGPYRDFAATDSVVRALAGLVKLVGPVDGPPLLLNDHQASIFAGLTAYSAALAALHAGGGRRFELSIFEASLVVSEFQIALRYGPPADERRQGLNKFYPTYPLGIYACREGWLGVTVGHLDQWAAFCELLDIEHIRANPRYQTRFDRNLYRGELDDRIGERLKARTAAEWFEIALRKRLPLVEVPTMEELLKQEVHRRNNAFQTVILGKAVFEGPAIPLHLGRSPPVTTARAPLVGEDARCHIVRTPLDALPPVAPDSRPLEGMRIVDLSMGWAGPLATRQLADLGAEVLKIEACAYPDWWRPTDGAEQRPFEHSPWFIALNRNKLDAAIDLYTPEGVALVKRLVAGADALVENFAANVMPKLGLAYEELREINPSLVMLSMPAYSGEWSELRAYGSTLEQGSGLPSVTGPADGPPVLNHLAYGDPVGGLNGCAALLTALLHRRRSGEGQHIVLSQVQAMLPLAAAWMIEQSVSGGVERLGNRHPTAVPHGVYPTADADGWLVISVPDDAAWKRLAAVIGLGDCDHLDGVGARRAAHDGIDARIAAWTAGRGGRDAMSELQRAGVPAGIAASPGDLVHDPHLVARGDWKAVDRRWSGVQPALAAPFREDGKVYPVLSPAPTLGEHNRYVLGGLLGLSDHEIAGLEAQGVVGDYGRPRIPKSS